MQTVLVRKGIFPRALEILGVVIEILPFAIAVQSYLVIPGLLACHYRGEKSLWLWEQYPIERSESLLWAIFLAYCYFVFYLGFMAVPYQILKWRFPICGHRTRWAFSGKRLFLAIWAGIISFTLIEPFLVFVRKLASLGAGGFPHIIWTVFLIIGISVYVGMEAKRREIFANGNSEEED